MKQKPYVCKLNSFKSKTISWYWYILQGRGSESNTSAAATASGVCGYGMPSGAGAFGEENVDGAPVGNAFKSTSSLGGLGCPYCGKVLPYLSDYQRHIRKHTGERPFACSHCSYATTRRSLLKTHVRKQHAGLDIAPCTWTMPQQPL